MKKSLVVGLVLVFVCELAIGQWLYRRARAIEENEKAQHQLIVPNLIVAPPGSDQKGGLVSKQDHSLDTRKAELERKEKQLADATGELTQRLAEFDKEKKKRDDQLHVLQLLHSGSEKVREIQFKRAQRDSLWIPGHETARGPPVRPNLPSLPTLKDQVNELESRYRQLELSTPGTKGEIAGREAALRELATSLAEAIGHDSASFYNLQAQIDVELALFGEVARLVGIPESIVPANAFELLDVNELRVLEDAQLRKVAEIKKRDALTTGLYKLSVQNEERRLEDIRSAKGKRPIDLAGSFGQALLTRDMPPAAVELLKQAGPSREAMIAQREAQLLQIALARDAGNIVAFLLLERLGGTLSPEEGPQFRLSADDRKVLNGARTRQMVAEQVQAAAPRDHSTIADTVEKLVEARFVDPVKAVELDAKLRYLYKMTNGEDRENFESWKAGHLTRGQLYELHLKYLLPARNYLSKLVSLNPAANQWLQIDQKAFEAIFAAFDKELGDRLTSGEDKPRHTTTNDPVTVEPVEIYRGLKVLSERVKGNLGVQAALRSKALDGLVVQLQFLESLREKVDRLAKEIDQKMSSLKELGESRSVPPEIAMTRQAIGKAAKAIELRLAAILLEESQNKLAQQLTQRTAQLQLANPPPENAKIPTAEDWADPFVTTQCRHVEKELLSQLSEELSDMTRRIKVLPMALEVAKLSYELHGDNLPHEIGPDGKIMEQFRVASKDEKIRMFAETFGDMYDEKTLEAVRDSLRAAKSGTLNKRARSEFRAYLEGQDVEFLGRDSIGREFFRIDGKVRVLHRVEGKVMNCPVYIAH